MVTCADGYTAAGDTEITMTCVFDLELTSMLLEGSNHSCQWALGDLSTLMPPSTADHECPKTVFGKSWIVDGSSGLVAISPQLSRYWLAVSMDRSPKLSISCAKPSHAPLSITCSTARCLGAKVAPWLAQKSTKQRTKSVAL